MRHRTQLANRIAAVERFYDFLADALRPVKQRRATKPTRNSKQRRLTEKRILSLHKKGRSSRNFRESTTE